MFADDEVTYDSNMQTKKFDVNVKVGKDGSYTVTENIKVKLLIQDMELPLYSIQRECGNDRTRMEGQEKNYFIMQILIC